MQQLPARLASKAIPQKLHPLANTTTIPLLLRVAAHYDEQRVPSGPDQQYRHLPPTCLQARLYGIGALDSSRRAIQSYEDDSFCHAHRMLAFFHLLLQESNTQLRKECGNFRIFRELATLNVKLVPIGPEEVRQHPANRIIPQK